MRPTYLGTHPDNARVGDFIFGGLHRIAYLVPGVTAAVPGANIRDEMYAVSLRPDAIPVRLHDTDLLIQRAQIEEIAHAVAERIQATEDLPVDIYDAAAKLFDPECQYLYANGIFNHPSEPVLRLLFADVMSKVYPEDSPWADEVARVACLAIFSAYLPE